MQPQSCVFTLALIAMLMLPASFISSNGVLLAAPTNATIVNLALQKSATQSSIDSGNSADRAVDGNSGTFAQTLSEVRPWWQVDLGEIGYVDQLRISTRADCCANQLRFIYVFTSEVPFVSNDIDEVRNQPEVTNSLDLLIGGGVTTTVEVQRSARYVRVHVRTVSPANLYLAEVEVMGIRVPPNSPKATGQWSAVLPLHNTVDAASVGHTWNSLSVVHLSVLPSKKLLFWGRDKLQSSTGINGWFDDAEGGSDAYLWDMTKQDNLSTPQDERLTLIRNTTTNLFCAGHSFLPNGDLFVAGGDSIPVDNLGALRFDLDGHGVTHTNIFDWKLEQWVAGPNMRQPRWYPSLLTLSDGQSLIVSGSFVTFNQPNTTKSNQDRDTEILARDGTLQRKGDLPVADLPNYPFAHLSPDGTPFVVSGTSRQGLFYNPSTGSWGNVQPNLAPAESHDQGTSVMYDRGKVMMIGGRVANDVSRNTETIDLNAVNPQWSSGLPMHFARYYATSVLMPDGKVFIIGGSKCTGANNLQTADLTCRNGAVMYPEIYDPDPVSPSWSVMARQQTVRMYHSVALLLPDARIMAAGGGRPGAFGEPGELKYLAHHEVEIFSPPYLFNANGSLATRPVVTSNPPDSIIYGQTFNIGVGNFTASEIQQVVLVRLPSVTHALNFDQQRVVLTKQVVGQQTLTLTAPTNGTHAAPGPYMLFVIGPNGAPSEARIVLLDNPPQTLTVASTNPVSGVSITVSPNDKSGFGNGTTQFSRTYNQNTTVSLTAPATAGGNNFQKWQRNGVDWSVSQATNVTLDANYTMTAVYVTGQRTLTVASTNPVSGVSITVSPNDNSGFGNGTTQFSRTYNHNTTVSLTAPATSGGNNFQKWQRNGVDWSVSQATNVTLDANYTMTAVYIPPQRTLTVASTNPVSGVSITVSPNDNSGFGNGATQFSRTYNQNTTVSLTAPATAGGNNFQKWQRNGVDWSVSQATNVTLDANYTMTAVYVTPCTPTAGLIISEFRLRGSTGSHDEYIELYNSTDQSITVCTVDGSSGWALVSSDGITQFVLPTGTLVPARSHYLAIGAGYSLAGYAAGDLSYSFDIPENSGLALFNTAFAANFTIANRFDAVGFTASNSLYREGSGLQLLGANLGEYSFLRKLNAGVSQDTSDNAADFSFVATNGGVYGSLVAILGSPGPENRFSPIQRNGTLPLTLLDPAVASSLAPNRVRDTTAVGPNAAFGTLAWRRTVTNNTGSNITKLRFRVVDITTLNTPGYVAGGSQSDMRVLSSSDLMLTVTGGQSVLVRGTTVESPPNQPSGGGLNSSLNVGVISLSQPLAPGQSVSVQLVVGLQQTGSFRFLFNVEALP